MCELVWSSGEIEVWQCDLDASVPAWDTLDAAERERAGRFRFAQDRHRFAARRSWLRQLLSRYLHTAAGQIAFHTGPHGKPGVPGLEFNLSACDGLALCALSRQRPVGVDVERLRAFAWEDIAGGLFHPAEVAHIRQAPLPERGQYFFRYWTAHEAIAKADGGGLTRPLAQVDCSSLVREAQAHLVDSTGAAWDCVSLVPRAGWVAALAVQSS